METIVLKTDALSMTDDEFFMFCQENDTLNLERDSKGNIYIMAPTGLFTSYHNNDLSGQLRDWNRKHKKGYTFDSNAGFTLPNNAVRSPDGAWIEKSRFEALSIEDREKFAPICPDFIFELKSNSDTLKVLVDKMNEWVENGCKLAWLIDRDSKNIHIFKPGENVVIKTFDQEIHGEDILSGFVLDLSILNNNNI